MKEQVEACLSNGIKPEEILNDGMVSAMAEVGRLFEEGEYFVPEMLISARAMKTGLAILRPLLSSSQREICRKGIDRHCTGRFT